ALFEVELAVEIGVRVAALLRAFLEKMDERVDIALGNVRVGRQIVFGVEQSGFSYFFIVAEQRVHCISWGDSTAAFLIARRGQLIGALPYPAAAGDSTAAVRRCRVGERCRCAA